MGPTALAVKVAITKDHTTYSYEMKRIGNGVFVHMLREILITVSMFI